MLATFLHHNKLVCFSCGLLPELWPNLRLSSRLSKLQGFQGKPNFFPQSPHTISGWWPLHIFCAITLAAVEQKGKQTGFLSSYSSHLLATSRTMKSRDVSNFNFTAQIVSWFVYSLCVFCTLFFHPKRPTADPPPARDRPEQWRGKKKKASEFPWRSRSVYFLGCSGHSLAWGGTAEGLLGWGKASSILRDHLLLLLMLASAQSSFPWRCHYKDHIHTGRKLKKKKGCEIADGIVHQTAPAPATLENGCTL